MILSDRDIRAYIKDNKIKITPCDLKEQLGPMSIDLRLSNVFRIFNITHRSHVDLKSASLSVDTDLLEIKDGEDLMLHPGEFVLGMTKETVELPLDIAARIDGRSSLGRLGIIVHSTAGHVDPGWKGRLTLEISNIGKLPIALTPGVKFCCLIFEQLSSPAEKGYSGKYLGQKGPSASRISEEFDSKKQVHLPKKS